MLLCYLLTVGIQGPQKKNSNFQEFPLTHLTKGSINAPAIRWLDTGDCVSISGLGRSPGEENGNPLQYSCLENSMNRGAWQTVVHGVPKSQTWPSNWTHTHTHTHTHAHTHACMHTLRGHGDFNYWGLPADRSCFLPVTVLQLSSDLAPSMEEDGCDIALQLTCVSYCVLTVLSALFI